MREELTRNPMQIGGRAMKRSIWIIMISGLVLIGCMRSTGVKPIYPKIGGRNYIPSTVKSLQPTFRWEPSPAADTYEFVIYEVIDKSSIWKGRQLFVGPIIYYRDGLKEPEHKIEELLKPGTKYYWTIRTRRGQEVSNWAVLEYPLFLESFRGWHYPFLFDTPEK